MNATLQAVFTARPPVDRALFDALARLHARAFQDRPTRPLAAEDFSQWLSLPGSCLVTATHDSQLAGFILHQCVPPEAELLSIAVDPALQNHGLGRGLVHHAYPALRDCGINIIHLEVDENNNRAIKFYQSLGFRQTGVRTNYYSYNAENAVSAHLYAYDLSVEGAGELPYE